MFDLSIVKEVLEDIEVQEVYRTYCDLAHKYPERVGTPQKLQPWIMNIAMGESGGFPLKKLVIGVIEAAIYTYSYTLEQHIEIADKDSQTRIDNSNLSDELKNKIKQNNKKLKDFSKELNQPKINELPKEDKSKRYAPSGEISLEHQFAVRSFETKVKQMSEEQAKSLLKDMYKQILIKEKIWNNFIKQQWGLS